MHETGAVRNCLVTLLQLAIIFFSHKIFQYYFKAQELLSLSSHSNLFCLNMQVSGAYRRKYESGIADMATTQTLEGASAKHDAGSSQVSSASQTTPLGSCMSSAAADPEKGLSPCGSHDGLTKQHHVGNQHTLKNRGPTLATGSRDLNSGPKVDLKRVSGVQPGKRYALIEHWICLQTYLVVWWSSAT